MIDDLKGLSPRERAARIAYRHREIDSQGALTRTVQRPEADRLPSSADAAEEVHRSLVESAKDKLPMFARSHAGGLTYALNEHSGGPAMVMFHANDAQGRFRAHETMTLEEVVRRRIM